MTSSHYIFAILLEKSSVTPSPPSIPSMFSDWDTLQFLFDIKQIELQELFSDILFHSFDHFCFIQTLSTQWVFFLECLPVIAIPMSNKYSLLLKSVLSSHSSATFVLLTSVLHRELFSTTTPKTFWFTAFQKRISPSLKHNAYFSLRFMTIFFFPVSKTLFFCG